MTPFAPFRAPAFALPDADVDTDIIFPARFLLHTEKQGLGRFAFHDRAAVRDRFAAAGSPPILLAGPNFGCGSSREHAVWALAGLGIRAAFAPSFGEIFCGNCANNGIVAGVLAEPAIARLIEAGGELTVDLAAATITGEAGTMPFAIGEADRDMLLAGWNTTTRIRARHGDAIAAFEDHQRRTQPGLWADEPIASASEKA